MKKKALIVTLAIVSLALITFNQAMFAGVSNDVLIGGYREAKIKSDNPISIDGNDAFIREARRRGWLGDGTELYPYIIENLYIKTPSTTRGQKIITTTAIDIRNTDLFFIITGCRLDGVDASSDGIFLSNVIHATIAGNVIYNHINGIWLQYCTGLSIIDNLIYDCLGSSIFLEESDYNIIDNNEISGDTGLTGASSTSLRAKVAGRAVGSIRHGIFLDPSNYNTITGNRIYNATGNGLYLQYSSNNLFTGNLISNSGESGVFLEGADNNEITGNDIYYDPEQTVASASLRAKTAGTAVGSIRHGIFLDPSNGNTVSNNNIYNSPGNGMYLLDSSNNHLTGNIVSNSGESGVFLEGSNNNEITGNDIYGSNDPNGASKSVRMKLTGTAVGSIRHGIFLDPSNANTIANNRVFDVEGNGLYLLDSDENTVTSNIVSNSGENGVMLIGADYNTITWNEIYGNPEITGSSTIIRTKAAGTAVGSIRHGIFLDPSNHNMIANNQIHDSPGNGLYLLDSDDNLVTGNLINNSGESGVFLNGSDYNTITWNDIYGDGELAGASTSFRTKMAVGSIRHGIFLDPSNGNTIANNNIYNSPGNGLYLQGSDNNALTGNEVSNSGGNGIFLEGSTASTVTHNVIYDSGLYGMNINGGSQSNSVADNDYVANNVGGTSQAYDDGSGNQFSGNFLVDHDNTDSNGDGIADYPYHIDGSANNYDESPYALPVQLEESTIDFEDLEVIFKLESETINLKNSGQTMNAHLILPVGYSATNLNISTIHIDGGIGIQDTYVQSQTTLHFKIDNQALIAYLDSIVPYTPYYLYINITGRFNGDFVGFYGDDDVTVIQDAPDAVYFELLRPMNLEKLSNDQNDNQNDEIILDQNIEMAAQVVPGLAMTILLLSMFVATVFRKYKRT
ncbi:MAG: right-handed parallel beta-helix repeat-containing protein [Candidatus Odinarchaeota archaeon]